MSEHAQIFLCFLNRTQQNKHNLSTDIATKLKACLHMQLSLQFLMEFSRFDGCEEVAEVCTQQSHY
jgi:hypothetical protein